MKTIQIEPNYELIVDDDDFEWISKRRWKVIFVKNRSDDEGKLFVVSAKNARCKLYRMINIHGNNSRNKHLRFRNGNRLDYRKSNLELFYNPPAEKTNNRGRSAKQYLNIQTVEKNQCVISDEPVRVDHLECATCYYVCRDRYFACLNVASDMEWSGWKHISGCEDLIEKINNTKQDVKFERDSNMFVPMLSYLIVKRYNMEPPIAFTYLM